MAGVYWVGQDGNVWYKSSTGTSNLGSASQYNLTGSNDTFLRDAGDGRMYTVTGNRIDDPIAPSGGGGGGVYPGVSQTPAGTPRPTAAQTDPLLASLASLDTVLANRNAQSQDEYTRAIAGYDAQDKLDRQAYDKGVQQNEQTLTANNQRAMLNAANGASGLRGVLSSLGGLAGSGRDVIARLVGLAANSDTGAARDTFDTNAGNLTTSWGRAEQQQRQRREDANATLANNKQNNEAGVLTSRQSIFQQLANLFGADAPEGRDYASKAASLAAPIAATSRATVAPYAAASSSYSPDALKNYLAGTQNLEVNTSGAGGSTIPVNSPLFSADRKKDLLPGVA